MITEGYATALTVNLLEVGSVVAAVDAGNLLSVAEAFRQKYPNTDMYIAGDNDFSDKEVNIGKESANKAAFAISAVISIPPTDYKCDWNDYYQKHEFLEFKKAFVDSASLPEELKGEPEIIEEFKNNVTFLPTSNTNKKSNPDTFIDIREDGVHLVEQVENEKTGKISILMEEWLCSKMNVVGLGISGREHYIILEWIDRKSNQLIKQGIPLADIGEREGWRTLKSHGIKVTTKSKLRTILADWLQREAVGDLWSITPRSGWHNGAYIMPDGSIIGESDKPILFNGGTASREAYDIKGDLQSWKENVASLAFGNEFQMLTIGIALAAPMILLVNTDGFGIHLYAQSTSGKTTAQDLAASLV